MNKCLEALRHQYLGRGPFFRPSRLFFGGGRQHDVASCSIFLSQASTTLETAVMVVITMAKISAIYSLH